MRAGPWANLRTFVVLSGGAFVLGSVGVACLDYAGEDWGKPTCDDGAIVEESDAGAPDAACDAAVAEPPTGSGSGSAAP